MAGFEVIIYGLFWVIAEVPAMEEQHLCRWAGRHVAG
jgi:hypothetical protein